MTTNITQPHLINEAISSTVDHTNDIKKEYSHQTVELNNETQTNGTDEIKNNLDTSTVSDVVGSNLSEIKSNDNAHSSADINKNSTANIASSNNSIQSSFSSTTPPPPIPHVEINQVPLSLIIRNITVYTIKEISQFLKTNLHQSFENNSTIKKVNFVKLIIFLRNQFLKLYVLIKWTKTIKNNNFHVLIDLLNWFRITNMTVNNCIWTLKNSLISMTNAKLPDVDLVTALEVLSLGRPNLPTYNLKLSGDINSNSEAIPTDLILKRLKDLNLIVSIKISLMDIPPQFSNYYIKNGRIYITVENEFDIQLSTVDRHSPLFFVDLNLNFSHSKDSNDFTTDINSDNNPIHSSDISNHDSRVGNEELSHNIMDNRASFASNKRMGNNIEYDLPLNKRRLEKIINDLLLKSSKPLHSLYQFLHKYVLTLQLYMVHVELTNLETFGKFSGGSNLVHSYDSKKGKIIGRYWLNGKLGNKGKFTIGVDKQSESLVLRWDNKFTIAESEAIKRIPIIYTHILQNVESILDEIMFNHANLIRSDLLSRGIFQEDEDDPTILLLHVPVTCVSVAPVQLKIDPITGQLFFKNPSPLLLAYTKKINRTETSNELITVLQQLKLDKITTILRNMFQKTGWICSRAVSLEKPIETKLIPNKNINEKKNSSQNNDELVLLQRDLFICLPNWPSNWYLILTIISSNSSCIVEKRMGRIVSQKGKWNLTYVDQTSVTSSKLENITYQKIMSLQKTILHRIINHMLIDSLNQLKIKNKICSPSVIQDILPSYLTSVQVPGSKDTDTKLIETDDVNANKFSASFNEDYTPILRLELDSFLDGYNSLKGILENSMFMRIDYIKSDIRLYARFKRGITLERVKCEEMIIHFVPEDPLTFYMTEKFSSLSHIVTYLNLFKEKLMQLVTIADVVERLHKNFESEHFQIMALKPNEISFKYLKSDVDKPDCSINIITEDSKIKNLTVKLSESNPQKIIQPYLNQENMAYHSIFNYLQFTSLFFTTLQKILKEHTAQKENQLTTVHLGIHNLSEYQLVYCNAEVNTKITLMINIRSVCHNSKRKVQYYVHFADDEHITTKSLAYPQVHQVKNQIFMFDPKKQAFSSNTDPILERKYPRAIRLIDGISCDAEDIEPILLDIHGILKADSNR